MQKILCIITARGGSKGIPNKNITKFNGKPLISYTIQAALALGKKIYRVVVSTDCEKIAKISKEYGAEVPFMRPAELATDQAASLPVVQHAVSFIEQQDNIKFDWVLLLQPTSPLRTSQDISNALDIALSNECDSVVSVFDSTRYHPCTVKIIEDGILKPFFKEAFGNNKRRQELDEVYKTNGAIYLTKRDVLMEEDSFYGEKTMPYIMPLARSMDIDDEIDLFIAEKLLERNNVS